MVFIGGTLNAKCIVLFIKALELFLDKEKRISHFKIRLPKLTAKKKYRLGK